MGQFRTALSVDSVFCAVPLQSRLPPTDLLAAICIHLVSSGPMGPVGVAYLSTGLVTLTSISPVPADLLAPVCRPAVPAGLVGLVCRPAVPAGLVGLVCRPAVPAGPAGLGCIALPASVGRRGDALA